MATYFTPSGNPPAQTRGTSPSIRAEFVSIQTGFASVDTDLTAETAARIAADALKAPLLSPALTGTPTAPTAAAGTNTTQLATTAFVVGTSLNANLPGQGGNGGKFITTDGATASWSPLLKSTVMRWADGTDTSKLMAWDLSGITTATTRTVTVPNKSGTLAMTTDVGMTTPLATLTPTAAANVDFLSVFSATYDNYRIIVDGIKPASDAAIGMSLASGGVVDAGANYEGATSFSIGSTSSTASAQRGITFVIDVLNANDATNGKVVLSIGRNNTGAGAYESVSKQLMYSGTNAVSGFRLSWSGGVNFAATGKVRVYGISN